MTRVELSNLDGQELASLIGEYDIYDIYDHLMGEDSLSEHVWSDISNWDDSWESLRDFLDSVPDYSHTGYFWMNDYGEISSIDTDRELRDLIYDDFRSYFEDYDLCEDEEEEDEEPSESQDEDGNVYYTDEDGNKYTVEIESVSALFFE